MTPRAARDSLESRADRPKSFTTLEAMRGIAAICVVLMHGDELFGVAAPRSAYLAVDFFFVLSGFIIAHVYAGRLDRGMAPVAFMGARLLRLYPLYIVGMISGAVIAAASLLRHSTLLWDYAQPLISFPCALFMLPSPVSIDLFPLDVPAWSLLLELIVNIAFSVRWLRSSRSMLVLMMLSALALSCRQQRWALWTWVGVQTNAPLGLARVFFSFPLGVILYRVHTRISLPSAFSAVPIIALAALLFADPSGAYRVALI